MIPANHDSRIEAQQLPRERFSPLCKNSRQRFGLSDDDVPDLVGFVPTPIASRSP